MKRKSLVFFAWYFKNFRVLYLNGALFKQTPYLMFPGSTENLRQAEISIVCAISAIGAHFILRFCFSTSQSNADPDIPNSNGTRISAHYTDRYWLLLQVSNSLVSATLLCIVPSLLYKANKQTNKHTHTQN